MLCPICNVDLLLSEKQGIEIDYCPKCRGIWLDRGELDKIVERSTEIESGISPMQKNGGYYHDDDDFKHHSQGNYKRKRKSFLGDLFDF